MRGGRARLFALDPSLLPTQYVLDNWQIPEGLPQSTAQAVARTPDGYLWVGTQEGLARFDGVKFTVFDSGNEPALPNKDICALLVDRAGRLWIGTRSGLAVLENGHFRTRRDRRAEARLRPRLRGGTQGRIWVGTESGLIAIEGDRVRAFDLADRAHGRAESVHWR